MLGYRHAFHAGNHADVLKHVTLVATLRHLMRKDAPLTLIDTHAGAGVYRLDDGAAQTSGEALDGIARLQALRKEAGAHTAALRLELRALQAAGRYADIPPLVDQLVKRKVYGATEADLIRTVAHAQVLQQSASDPAGLRSYWNRLSDADQQIPRIAAAGARAFLTHDFGVPADYQ